MTEINLSRTIADYVGRPIVPERSFSTAVTSMSRRSYDGLSMSSHAPAERPNRRRDDKACAAQVEDFADRLIEGDARGAEAIVEQLFALGDCAGCRARATRPTGDDPHRRAVGVRRGDGRRRAPRNDDRLPGARDRLRAAARCPDRLSRARAAGVRRRRPPRSRASDGRRCPRRSRVPDHLPRGGCANEKRSWPPSSAIGQRSSASPSPSRRHCPPSIRPWPSSPCALLTCTWSWAAARRICVRTGEPTLHVVSDVTAVAGDRRRHRVGRGPGARA